MFISILLMGLGLIILIKGSDIFVDAGSAIGKAFKMSEVMIGLTIVCIGTGLPELLVSMTASASGNSELIIGNIIGSNIFNMCCILGMVCIMNPLKLLRDTVRKDMYMSLLSGIIIFILLLDTFGTKLTANIISRTDGIILLMFFAVYVYYTMYEFGEYLRQRREKKYEEKMNKNGQNEKVVTKDEKILFTIKDVKKLIINIVLVIVGGAMVYAGSELIVKNAVIIATGLGVSQTFISIIVIAVGTSLPEISTSISAIRKNRINIAIGNLIGSNMYNTLLVIGLASLTNPIEMVSTSILVDCGVFILISLVMILFTKRKQEISRAEGLTLISIYLFYISFVIYRK